MRQPVTTDWIFYCGLWYEGRGKDVVAGVVSIPFFSSAHIRFRICVKVRRFFSRIKTKIMLFREPLGDCTNLFRSCAIFHLQNLRRKPNKRMGQALQWTGFYLFIFCLVLCPPLYHLYHLEIPLVVNILTSKNVLLCQITCANEKQTGMTVLEKTDGRR